MPEETPAERRARAMTNALHASKLLSDQTVYDNVIAAVKAVPPDSTTFHNICRDLKIPVKARDKLWTLILIENQSEPTGVCW